MSEPKVAKDVATQEFQRWVEAMGIGWKLDPADLDDADKHVLAAHRKCLIHAVMSGRLVCDEEGVFVLTTVAGDTLKFNEPKGAALMESDTAKAGAMVHKEFKYLGAMTGKNVSLFSAMPNRDLEICLAISALFLGK